MILMILIMLTMINWTKNQIEQTKFSQAPWFGLVPFRTAESIIIEIFWKIDSI